MGTCMQLYTVETSNLNMFQEVNLKYSYTWVDGYKLSTVLSTIYNSHGFIHTKHCLNHAVLRMLCVTLSLDIDIHMKITTIRKTKVKRKK